jgi:SPP1 gp7 family putative phage head morphogenesis protein
MIKGGANSAMRQALIIILKAQRQKMSVTTRQRRAKPARWLYPWAQERHYAASIRNWMRPMREYVQNFLTTNSEAILHGDSASAVIRKDATPGKTFKLMVDSLNGWVGKYVPEKPAGATYGEIFDSPIYVGLSNIAKSTFDFNGKQYEKSAKHSLGIDFPVDESWWKYARSAWIDQNYALIQSDLKKYIAQVNSLTEKAVISGWSVGTLKKEIQTMDGKMKDGRANFIARDQIGKLNGQITQSRMESAGLSMYEWSTSGDERVRTSHRLMDGKLCRWDDAAVYSQDGGKTWKPRPSGAVMLHPGADYQCRCCALAYWNEIMDEADAAGVATESAAPPKKFESELKPSMKATEKPTEPTKEYQLVDKKGMKEWEEEADRLFDELTANQSKALKMYSASDFYSMNKIQYDADYAKSLLPTKLAEIKKMNKDAAAAIDKGVVKSDIVVFRGENPGITEKWQPGEIHTRKGFLSTALSKKKAFITNESVCLEIRIPSGAIGAYIGHQSLAGNERELLLQADSSFKVIERKAKRLL